MKRRRIAQINRQTPVKGLVVDVCTTVERYEPSYLDIQMEWHCHCTLFAITTRRKRGIYSTREISHREGPDHVVGPEREHAQVLELAKHGRRDSAGDVDPAAHQRVGTPPEPVHVHHKDRPWRKMGAAPSVMKTDTGHCDEREGTMGKKDGHRRMLEAEERTLDSA
jgi:hypothetical protein